MRPSSRAKRRAILDAAAEAFVRDGFDRASMDDIAAHAQVSKQTLYSHFGNKDGLFAQVMAEETARALAQIPLEGLEAATAGAGLAARLARLGEDFLAVILTPRMIGLRRLAIAESRRFPEIAEAFARCGRGRSHAALAAEFGRCIRAGLLQGDPDAAAAAFLLLVVIGPVDRAMFDPAPVSGADRTARVADGVRIFLAAFGAAPRAAADRVEARDRAEVPDGPEAADGAEPPDRGGHP